MGIFTSGAMAQVGNGNIYLKKEPKGTVFYILHDTLESILSAAKYGVFTASGKPFNASWVSIGKEDVGNELGEKPQAKAFVWVLVPNNPKNLEEGFSVKLWEASKAEYETISTQVTGFGQELQGMMVVMQKPTNRWTIAANKPVKSKAVAPEILASEWESVTAKGFNPTSEAFDEAEFGKLVGVIPSPALQRQFLIQRSQGKCPTWNAVRKAFGLPAVVGGDDGEVENDTEEYGE